MMYTENSSHPLYSSSSVPQLFSSPNGRVSQPNVQKSSYCNLQTQQKVVRQGLNLNKPNNFNLLRDPDQKNKSDIFDLSSSLNLSQGKKFTFTHNQIDDKSFRFQFKRNSAVNNRTGNKLQQSKVFSKKESYIYPHYAQPTQSISHSQLELGDAKYKEKINQMQSKIKDLENQLKFQEKYANDLYISSEEVKKQCSKVKQQNRKLQQTIQSLTNEKEFQTNELQTLNSRCQYQTELENKMRDDLQQQNLMINGLQQQNSAYLKQIAFLKEKINNFSLHYQNQLYQERIKQLNEEIYKTRTQLTQAVIQKNRLSEELKATNQKMMILNLDSPSKKAFNANQKTNQVINMAFEQSIKSYKRDIESLKDVIQQQQEVHRSLSEEANDLRRQIQGLKEDQKINSLKYATQRRNIINDHDRKITEKTNQINSLSNKLIMLQQKYGKALKQIKDKDQFLQKYLVGRAKDFEQKEYIQQVLQCYQQSFESRYSLQRKLKQLQQSNGLE